jgi:hypothetical protein
LEKTNNKLIQEFDSTLGKIISLALDHSDAYPNLNLWKVIIFKFDDLVYKILQKKSK